MLQCCDEKLYRFEKQGLNATTPSAKDSAHVKQNHLLSKDRQMPQNHQPVVLHMSNRITYSLKTGNHQPSGSAYVKQNHLHPKDRQMPQNHQQKVLHMSNRITYIPKDRQMPQNHQPKVLHMSNRITYI
jgi:hypothetical protein